MNKQSYVYFPMCIVVILVPCCTVPVVQKTWGKQTKHIEYYSEEADESIPTIDLGVPNTEGGECKSLSNGLAETK